MNRLAKAAISLVLTLAAAITASAVVLSWDSNPPNDMVIAYLVYQGASQSGPWTNVAVTTATSYTNGLPPANYFWCVAASNFWGEGPRVSIKTPPPAGPVTNLKSLR